ncbi:MAG: site-specific integrase [Lachnospiraceae bacterium]|nr:site-specific integrase [Lachnospiraceae bacterium]
MGRHGENIRKREDGRWEARVIQGAPREGRTNYKYFYGKSYRNVKRKKTEYLLLLESEGAGSADMPSPGRMAGSAAEKLLFRQVVEEWLASKQTIVKESTLACYTTMAEAYILPKLVDLSPAQIDVSVLAGFLAEQKEHGRHKNGGMLSGKTLADLRMILMQILSFAKARGMIRAVPDCPSVSVRPAAPCVLTKREQELLEQAVLSEDNPFSLGILLSLYGGLRIGEVCALRWGDFDRGNGTVHISRTVSRIADLDASTPSRTKLIIDTPKTDCSIRTVPLPAPVFRYLVQRSQCGENYVVTGSAKYMEPRVCRERYKRLLRRAGVPGHTYHSLRHTFATRCVENGVDMKSLSEIMGHSDVKITMQRYVHPSMDAKREQIDKLPCFDVSGQNRGHQNTSDA